MDRDSKMKVPAANTIKRSWWPLAIFYLVMAVWSLGSTPAVDWYLKWGGSSEAAVLWIFGGVAGKLLFCVLLAGLLSRSWLLGLSIATVSGISTIALVIAGASTCSNVRLAGPNDSGISVIFLIPALMLFGASPFYLLRFWRGCFLSRGSSIAAREQSRLEDLFIATLVVAACLLFAQLPATFWRVTAGQFWATIAMATAMFVSLCLLSVFPWSLRLFTASTKVQQAIIFFRGPLLFLVVAAVLSKVWGEASGQGSDTWDTIMDYGSAILGAATVLGFGIWALLKSKFLLVWPAAVASHDLSTGDRDTRLHNRVIACVILLFAVAAGFTQGSIQSSRRLAWHEHNALSAYAVDMGGQIALDNNRRLVSVELGTPANDDSLEQFRHLRHVTRISLAKSGVTDAGLKTIRSFQALQDLDLSETNITSASVPTLSQLENLSQLSIARTTLTVDDVLAIIAAKPLRFLDVSEMNLTEAALLKIAAKHHNSLAIRGYELDDAAIARVLAGHKFDVASVEGQFWTLDLGSNPIDGSCLNNYETALAELKLHDTALTDEAFGPVAQKLNVGQLHLANTRLTNEFLASLETAKNIRALHLGTGKISEQGLARMKRVQFEGLALNAKQFTGECFRTWKPQIRRLDMSRSGLIDNNVKHLHGLARCIIVDLSDTNITDASLPELAKLNAIFWLNLSGTSITAEGLARSELHRIQHVRVAFGQFTDLEIQRIRKAGISIAVGGPSW